MGAMTLPGFTADVSVCKTSVGYQAAAAPGRNDGVSPQWWPSCVGIGENCSFRFPCCSGACINGTCACTSDSDCSTGFCNPYGQCDCVEVGDYCQAPRGSPAGRFCCSGQCAADGTCASPEILITWKLDGYSNGLVTVVGTGFNRNAAVQGGVDNCLSGGFNSPLFNSPLLLPGDTTLPTDSNGSFIGYARCWCGGSTTASATDFWGLFGSGSAPIPC
jgi:hypothetical protein